MADLPKIINPPQGESQITPLTRLRHSHHKLAQLLAAGEKDVTCAQIMGYSQSRISILKNDPAFKELLEYYKTQNQQIYADVHARLAQLGTDAMDELQQRLDEDPESFTHRQLLEVVEMTFDRSVAPSKSAKDIGPGNGGQAAPISLVVNFRPAISGPPSEGPITVLELEPNKE